MTDHSRTPTAAGEVPGEPPAIEFANTHYARRGKVHEGLASRALLADWLRTKAGHPLAPEPTEAELAAFLRLRDTIRSLIRAVVDNEPLDPAQVAALNEAAALAPSWPTLDLVSGVPAVIERSGQEGVAPALGAIARDAVRLLGGADRAEVRACPARGCVQYFVKDHPRREYCCGACANRARAARHYQRHRDG